MTAIITQPKSTEAQTASNWREVASDPVVESLKKAHYAFSKKSHAAQLQLAIAALAVNRRFGIELSREIIQNCLRVKSQVAAMYANWGSYYGAVPNKEIWRAIGAKAMKLLVVAKPSVRSQVIEDILMVSQNNQEKHGSLVVGECYVSTKLSQYGDAVASMANKSAGKKKRQEKEAKKAVKQQALLNTNKMLAALKDVRDAVVRDPIAMEPALSADTLRLLRDLE